MATAYPYTLKVYRSTERADSGIETRLEIAVHEAARKLSEHSNNRDIDFHMPTARAEVLAQYPGLVQDAEAWESAWASSDNLNRLSESDQLLCRLLKHPTGATYAESW